MSPVEAGERGNGESWRERWGRPTSARHVSLSYMSQPVHASPPPLEACAEENADLGHILSSEEFATSAMSVLLSDLLGAGPFFSELATASRVALEASVLAIGAWSRVAWLVMQPVSRLAVAAWPSVRSGLAATAAAAVAQPKKAIAIEAAALIILIVLFRFARFVRRRRYVSRAREALRQRRERFVAGVARRSRVLAAALPHLSYGLACAACSRVADRLGLRARWVGLLLAAEPALSTGVPTARSLYAQSGSAGEQRLCLQYWVVWACVHLCIGLLYAVPLASRVSRLGLPLLGRFPMLREVPCFFWLWLQLPGDAGLRLAYGTLAPELQRRSNAAAALLPAPPERLMGVLQMVLATAIGFERRTALAEIVQESRVLIGGVFFLLTPTPIAAVGLLLLAYGGPLLRSIDALPLREGAAASAPTQLRYWWSYALLCGALNVLEPALRWVPFMTHWQLLAVLWLQVPFLRTATRLLSHLVPPVLSQMVRSPTPPATERIAETSRPNAVYSEALMDSRRAMANTGSTGATGTS